MQSFAELIDRLELASGDSAKLALVEDYFSKNPDPARGWVLAVLVGELTFKRIKTAELRTLVSQRVDKTLFELSYDFVGDIAETTSLIWPETHGANTSPDFVDVIETLQTGTVTERLQHIERWLDALDAIGRRGLLKLVTNGERSGVTAHLIKQALAKFGQVDVTDIEGIWHGLEPPYLSLFDWLEGKADRPAPDIQAPFRPVMLAQLYTSQPGASEERNAHSPEISPDMFAAEWKWDGLRIQASANGDTRRLYTRSGDDISAAFPDILGEMNFDGILEGELFVRGEADGRASYNDLEFRLKRKTVSKKMLIEKPAFIRAYDLLQSGCGDHRSETFRNRRMRLENLISSIASPCFSLSELIDFDSVQQLETQRNASPHPEIAGLMLKRWDSRYEAGRPDGQWLKWNNDPYLIDAVIMYAQRGQGRRSGHFSEVTFGVWRGPKDQPSLTPIGKTEFSLSDDALNALNKFVRENTIERFGPVHSLAANAMTGFVIEVAFERLHRSKRHKSGVIMRYPRINRVRLDKPPSEAGHLDVLEQFIS